MLVAPCDACCAGRRLNNTQLTGALPSELGLLTRLSELYVGCHGRKDGQGRVVPGDWGHAEVQTGAMLVLMLKMMCPVCSVQCKIF